MTELTNQEQALFNAIEAGDVEQVKTLLAAGVALDRKDTRGRTPLTLASGLGNLEILQALLAANAAVNLAPKSAAHNCPVARTWENSLPKPPPTHRKTPRIFMLD
jgi:ankyrin repeat protein